MVFRDKTAKNKKQRSVPVHERLAQLVVESRPENAQPADRIFPSVPSYERMRADLVLAGIEHRDALGRVVHFHAIRKTFQTLGANNGINQRAAQELLGHSD
jgi:integrase